MSSRVVVAALAGAGALCVAPSALAKGPFEVCGPSACAELSPETQLPVRLGVAASTPTLAPVAPAPYFVIRFHDFPDALAYWIPSAAVLRLAPQNGSAVWVAPLPSEASLLREKTGDLRPYAAPTNVLAAVDGRRVSGGDGYLRLYTIGRAAKPVGAGGWLPIWLLGGQSPWNDGTNRVAISRRGSFLRRDGRVVRIPPALARRIRAALPLGRM
jgi:hypothetical protein